MSVKKFDLENRLVEFAAHVALFCKKLPKDMVGQYYGNQLLRSGGSAALNFGEAQGTNSNKDYINKASISLKELKESRVSLKVLHKLGCADQSQIPILLDEAEQLIKIMATIIKNKK
ncbi:four helix bundle protein [Ulvibacterium sp.]|uniref:four helix bundle protein n=1 Tax=Ulvibacterium sp. TaxID=2665914 RepID=UPI002622E106|nr:four helix bundle protein [Ulvibacterium sp.]